MNVNIFFTSDWHIGHKKVLERRPNFKSLEEMHQTLIENYNNLVRANDLCYFLGDVAVGPGPIIKEVLLQLNGVKILILGNHDARRGKQFWHECGFTAIQNVAAIKVNNQLVTMSHCPLIGIYREDTKGMLNSSPNENWYKEAIHGKYYSLPYFGQFHLHGHIHSPNGGRSKTILGKQYDVGVDGNDFKPVSLSKVASWVTAVLNENL